MRSPDSQITTVSTLTSGAQVMGIDESGMGTVLSILSNMYSDGSFAVVREYASNAFDSHVEAGNSDPILVTSPSFLNPALVVQDFGVGLSGDEVLNVYAKYGASTKRNTNEQIGSFGIGAKSAFTVGTQFVVTAIKNSEKTVALFALDSSGAPTVNILSTELTDEPNGVKVEIGVKDINGINNAISKLFSTWAPGTVLVDGVEPASIWAKASPVAEDIHIVWKETQYDDSAWMVVMGGVSYQLNSSVVNAISMRNRNIIQKIRNSYAKVILTVPIGSVDITPSREELRVTDKTIATIEDMVTRFHTMLPGWIEDQIQESKSFIEAIINRSKMVTHLGYSSHNLLDHTTWQGKRIPTAMVTLDEPSERIVLSNRRHPASAKRYKEVNIFPGQEINHYLFVVNTPPKRVRSVQLAAKPYLTQASSEPVDARITTVVTVSAQSLQKDWLDTKDPAVKTVDFEDFIKEWKPQTVRRASSATLYTTEEGDNLTAKEISDLNEPVLYFWHGEARPNSGNHLIGILSQTNMIIYLRPTQKAEVFLKKVPQAKHAAPHMRKAAEDVLANMTQNDADIVAANHFLSNVSRDVVSFLTDHENEITSQAVRKLIGTYRKSLELTRSTLHSRIENLKYAAGYLNKVPDWNPSVITLDTYTKVQEGLPLLFIYREIRYRNTPLGDQHVIDYVNSINL